MLCPTENGFLLKQISLKEHNQNLLSVIHHYLTLIFEVTFGSAGNYKEILASYIIQKTCAVLEKLIKNCIVFLLLFNIEN